MDRINTATKAVDLYGAGKHGYKDGNLGLGIAPTDLNAAAFNGFQEELLALIEGAGVVPALATLTQVRQAIKRLTGSNVRTITAAGPTALTADDAGYVVLDATSNAVSITLPAVNAVTGVPLFFAFVRIDSTGNAVTVSRAGADTFVGATTSFTLVGQGDFRAIMGDASSKWGTVGAATVAQASTAEVTARTAVTKYISPDRLNYSLQVAKAWATFDGTSGSPTASGRSHNVGSITKNGTGDYTINLTTALADANYAAVVNMINTQAFGAGTSVPTSCVYSQTTSACRIRQTQYVGTTNTYSAFDALSSVAIFGNT